jgi:all-trans-retinol dehydrogenase (NAD+)
MYGLLFNVVKSVAIGTVRLVYSPKKNLKGEIVVVTGGASGIGRLMSLIFAKKGARVVIVDISSGEKVVEEIQKQGGEAHAFTCDLSKREEVYRVADEIRKKVGDVTILINNAGIVSGQKLLQCRDELIAKTMDVNTTAHFWTTKAFLPSMLEKNHGHVVTIASSAGLVGVAGLVDYCASKFGAFGFDESLRLELHKIGKTGVHTTSVCPYFINTGMFDGCKTRFPLLLPILEPDYAANKIVTAVETNQQWLCMPWLLYTVPMLRSILPVTACDDIARFLGASNSMDDFKGRK